MYLEHERERDRKKTGDSERKDAPGALPLPDFVFSIASFFLDLLHL